MTLSRIGIKSFRAFREEEDFNIKPITILTGTNSSGKSSLIKAIRLFQSSFEEKDRDIPFFRFLYLKHFTDLNIGHFDYWINENSTDKTIVYSLPFYFACNTRAYKIYLSYNRNTNQIPGGDLTSIVIKDEVSGDEVVKLSQKEIKVDIIELWTRLLEFHAKHQEFERFISSIQEKLNTITPELYQKEWEIETDDYYQDPGYDYTHEFINAYLSDRKGVKISHFWGDIELSFELLKELLTPEEYNYVVRVQKAFF